MGRALAHALARTHAHAHTVVVPGNTCERRDKASLLGFVFPSGNVPGRGKINTGLGNLEH